MSSEQNARPRSVWSTSERWGSVFALGFLLGILGDAIRWATGTDESDAPWTVTGPIAAALILLGAAGWIITRGLEMRRGTQAGLIDAARPWVAPLAAILAIGVIYWAISDLVAG